MELTVIQTLLLGGALWMLYKLFESYLAKTSFDNIPRPAPQSLLTGNLGALFDTHGGWAQIRQFDDVYGSVVRLRGFLGGRVLYVFDPVALHHVFAHDGVHYDLTESQYAIEDMLFGPGLSAVSGAQHKRQRKMLNPVFTTDNVRKMTPIFYEISRKLRDTITTVVEGSPTDVDVVHWLSRMALEMIAQAGLGHSFDPLTPDTHAAHPICEALKSIIPVYTQMPVWQMLAGYLARLGPPSFRRWLADLAVVVLPDPNLRRLRDIVDTMDVTTKDIFNKKRAMQDVDEEALPFDVENKSDVGSKDIMSILLKANAQSDKNDQLSDQELVAQMSTMLFGGIETVSSAISHALQMLATYPDIQGRLREELAAAHNSPGEDISYETLTGLPFLDAVCRETLRLYAPAILIPRETVSDVIMPLQKPITGIDGNPMRELHVPKGTLILPGYLSCNTSKGIWGADALEWKPDRWLSPLPATVTEARIPGISPNLMTFGGGYKSCIGYKFAQLEMKIVLAVLVESFRFSLTDKEIFWNFSTISYPTMDEKSVESSLFLKLESISQEIK